MCRLVFCDKDVRILAVGKLISLNIDESYTVKSMYMYVFELKQNHYLQKCGHVGIFYTEAHVHKIRYKVENFEAWYMNGKMQNGEKGVQKVSSWCNAKRKKRVFLYIFLQGRFIIVFELAYDKSIYVGMTRGTLEKIVV